MRHIGGRPQFDQPRYQPLTPLTQENIDAGHQGQFMKVNECPHAQKLTIDHSPLASSIYEIGDILEGSDGRVFKYDPRNQTEMLPDYHILTMGRHQACVKKEDAEIYVPKPDEFSEQGKEGWKRWKLANLYTME
jgi:hypothetical protein